MYVSILKNGGVQFLKQFFQDGKFASKWYFLVLVLLLVCSSSGFCLFFGY